MDRNLVEGQENKFGISETKDVLDLLDMFLDEAKEALDDDGKIDMMECVEAAIQSAPKAVAAFAGIDKVDDEMKDLTKEELNELVAHVLLIVKKVVAFASSGQDQA